MDEVQRLIVLISIINFIGVVYAGFDIVTCLVRVIFDLWSLSGLQSQLISSQLTRITICHLQADLWPIVADSLLPCWEKHWYFCISISYTHQRPINRHGVITPWMNNNVWSLIFDLCSLSDHPIRSFARSPLPSHRSHVQTTESPSPEYDIQGNIINWVLIITY